MPVWFKPLVKKVIEDKNKFDTEVLRNDFKKQKNMFVEIHPKKASN